MKKLLLFCLTLLLLQSCRFDPEERNVPIIGRFSINQFKYGETVSINHNYTESYSTGLAEGNLTIKCDTIGKILYVKDEVHQHYTRYQIFKVLDENSQDSKSAYEEKEVNEKEFNTLLNDCKNCITVDWPYDKPEHRPKHPDSHDSVSR